MIDKYIDMEDVGYAFVVADLIHYGHLNFLRECKKHCNFLIVGVYTDELTETYKRKPIISFKERIEMVEALKPVDMVVAVHNKSCVPMLNKLINDGWNIKKLFHGSDWNPKKDMDFNKSKNFIEGIGGELIQPKYYEKESSTKIINRIIERFKRGENLGRGYRNDINR